MGACWIPRKSLQGMVSFKRALRYTWPYRGRLALSLGSGVIVAVLWGANISAVYPLLTVLLKGQTLVDWVDERIAADEAGVVAVEKNVAELNQAVRKLEQQRVAQPNAGVDDEIKDKQKGLTRRDAE